MERGLLWYCRRHVRSGVFSVERDESWCWVVLATVPGYPASVRVGTDPKALVRVRNPKQPDPLWLGGFVTRTGHKPAASGRVEPGPRIHICGSGNCRSN